MPALLAQSCSRGCGEQRLGVQGQPVALRCFLRSATAVLCPLTAHKRPFMSSFEDSVSFLLLLVALTYVLGPACKLYSFSTFSKYKV